VAPASRRCVWIDASSGDAAAVAERLSIPVRTMLDRAAAPARGATQSALGTLEPERGTSR
jgi:hypothetical protein